MMGKISVQGIGGGKLPSVVSVAVRNPAGRAAAVVFDVTTARLLADALLVAAEQATAGGDWGKEFVIE